jgi:hypothetical protein
VDSEKKQILASAMNKLKMFGYPKDSFGKALSLLFVVPHHARLTSVSRDGNGGVI